MKLEIENIVGEFCRKTGIEVKLSFDMPAGYETAYGTYDVTQNTLFFNADILHGAPLHEVLFYLFHELRHAVQYQHPTLFSEEIRESIFYVILYNGVCFKLIDNEWIECYLNNADGNYLTRAYMSLPYEIDANMYAYEKAKEICGDTAELNALLDCWLPNDKLDYIEHKKLFRMIDSAVKRNNK